MAVRLRSFEPTSRRQQSFLTLFRSAARFFCVLALLLLVVWGGVAQHTSALYLRQMCLDGLAYGVYVLQAPLRGIQNLWWEGASYFSLKGKNDALLAENDRLRQALDHQRYVLLENAQLKRQVQLVESVRVTKTARLGGMTRYNGVDSLFLLSGDHQGLQPRQAVHVGGYVVGRILETGRQSARVLMVTDRSSRLPIVLEKSGVRGIAAGDGGGFLSVFLKKGEADVHPGEMVFTSGEGGIYPQGLVVGEVVSTHEGQVTIKPGAHAAQARFVSVVDDPIDLDGGAQGTASSSGLGI